jgi:DNA primase
VERRIRDVQSQLTRLSGGADPAQLAAVQNELWVLQQYDQSLREHGAAAL